MSGQMLFGIPDLNVPGGIMERLIGQVRQQCGAAGSATTEIVARAVHRSVESVEAALKLAERLGLVTSYGRGWRVNGTQVEPSRQDGEAAVARRGARRAVRRRGGRLLSIGHRFGGRSLRSVLPT